MTRDEAIAEAKHRQASDPDANWIAASRDGEWTVVRIVKPDSATCARRKADRCVRGGAVAARARAFGEGPH